MKSYHLKSLREQLQILKLIDTAPHLNLEFIRSHAVAVVKLCDLLMANDAPHGVCCPDSADGGSPASG